MNVSLAIRRSSVPIPCICTNNASSLICFSLSPANKQYFRVELRLVAHLVCPTLSPPMLYISISWSLCGRSGMRIWRNIKSMFLHPLSLDKTLIINFCYGSSCSMLSRTSFNHLDDSLCFAAPDLQSVPGMKLS